jgi:uncharacterized protein YkwD
MRRFVLAVAVLATAAVAGLTPAAAPPSSVSAAARAAHDAGPSPSAAASPQAPANRSLDVRLGAADAKPAAAPAKVASIDAARGPDRVDPAVTSVTQLAAPVGNTGNLVRDDNSSQVLAVFNAINAWRAQNGLNPVRYHLSVQGLAQEWSDSIASREVIEHRANFWTDPRALNPDNGAGEVIAVRWDRDAAQLVEWWKSSPSHNAILLDPRLNVVGIGITFTNGNPTTTPNRYAMWGVVDFFGYTALPAGTTASPGGTATPPSPAPPPLNPPAGTPVTPTGAQLCAAATRFQPTTQDTSKASLHSPADVVAVNSAGAVVAYPGAGGKLGAAPTTLGTGFGSAISVQSVDWNRDGILDLLVQWGDGRLVLYPGLAAGQFGAPVTLGQSGWDTMTLTTGLWCSANRLPQILAVDPSGNLYLYANRGTGDIHERALLATGVPAGKTALLDASGDGLPDLVVQRSDGALVLYRSLGQQQLVNEARPVVASGWGTTGALRVLQGLDGAGSVGIAALRTDGSLAYWPVSNGAFGAPRVLATGWAGMRLG